MHSKQLSNHLNMHELTLHILHIFLSVQEKIEVWGQSERRSIEC